MSLKGQQRPVPIRFETPGFVLHRQRLSDNDKDHEAVMDSKEVLREWSGSSWPEDDFTPEGNAEDLAGHIDDYEKDLAYASASLPLLKTGSWARSTSTRSCPFRRTIGWTKKVALG